MEVTSIASAQQSSRKSKLLFRHLLQASLILALVGCGGSSSNDPLNTGVGPDAEVPELDAPPVVEGPVIEGPVVEGPVVSGPDVIDVSDPAQCNAATQKQWAYNSMQDFYLFYDQVPAVDPQSYDSPDDLVRQVRFQERDDFSNVSDATSSALQFDEGREFGLGYGWRYNADTVRITEVVDDSPFGQAGIERGDIILSVDDLQWDDEALAADFRERVFGTPDNPSTASWSFQKRDTAQIVTLDITAAEYDINTVIYRDIFRNDSFPGAIGYLAFSRFLETSEDELNSAYRYFQQGGITELVLDLRYNSGGRILIARQLASLIAGSALAGQPIYEYRFNDKYTANNYTLDFLPNTNQSTLNRIVILTTGNTASASEIVIAGLQPYIDVVTIGSTTVGKPYVSYAYDRCDERLNVIEAEGYNAAGNSVFGGIPPTCFVEDDPTRDFGLNDAGEFEGMLAAGVNYIEDGTCPSAPLVNAARGAPRINERFDNRHGMTDTGGALAIR